MTSDTDAASAVRAFDAAITSCRAALQGWRGLPDARVDEILAIGVDLSLDLHVAGGDPARPQITEFVRPDRKIAGDQPGTWYHTAVIAPDGVYELTGEVGDSLYIGVQVYGSQGGFNLPTANVGGDAIAIRDGAYRVVLGGDDPGDGLTWLPLAPGDHAVIVRQYHRDPSAPCPPAQIRVLAPPAGAFSIAEATVRASAFFEQLVLGTIEITDMMEASGVNAYPAPDAEIRVPKYGGALFPTRDNRYDGFYLDLAPGQHIELRGRVPHALFSSIVFYDILFTTPDDPACSVNDAHLLARFPDREYVVSIGPEDPGDGSVWVSTAGQTSGIVASRYLLAEDDVPVPEIRVAQR